MQPEIDIYAIIATHLNGHATAAEEQQLRQWLDASNDHLEEYNDLVQIWEDSSADKLPEPNSNKLWDDVSAKIFPETVSNNKTFKLKTLYWALPIAAALGGAIFFARSIIKVEKWIEYSTQEIAGSVILPDNSTVWLKPYSQIEYPEKFANRTVKLVGEGFFDVESDPNAPFKVETEYLETTVLGTEFTVEARPDDSVHHVILLEGKVSVKTEMDSTILTPGEALAFSIASNSVVTDSLISGNTISWVRKELVFNETPLRRVLEDMQIYYDFELDMPEAPYLDCSFTGTFRDNPPIEDILETLAFTLHLEYQWENETLVIITARCKQIQ